MLAFASIMLAFCKRAASELLRALARPGSFLIAASLIITLSAKAFVLPSASFNERWFTASSDIAFHFFLLALFAGIERFGRRAGLLISALFGGAVFTLSILNFFYLTITKTQLQAHSLALGLSRAGETLSIAINHAETSTLSELFIILSASLIAFIALHFASRRLASSERDRTLPTIAFLALALISFAASPSASPQGGRLDLELLARSAHFETARTLPGLFKDDAPLIEATSGLTHFEIPLAVPAPSPPERPPNIFLIILESTRFDHVEMPLEGHQSKARTPTIRKLAEEGAFFTRAYTPMPHTSKAIFAILCGRLPIMRQPIAEPFVAFHERLCLPQVLSERGYESAFFQTAIGAFERRPQLVERAGFDYFEAFETSDITPVGYLGGDDRELGRIITRWLEQREDLRGLSSSRRSPRARTIPTSSLQVQRRLPPSLARALAISASSSSSTTPSQISSRPPRRSIPSSKTPSSPSPPIMARGSRAIPFISTIITSSRTASASLSSSTDSKILPAKSPASLASSISRRRFLSRQSSPASHPREMLICSASPTPMARGGASALPAGSTTNALAISKARRSSSPSPPSPRRMPTSSSIPPSAGAAAP